MLPKLLFIVAGVSLLANLVLWASGSRTRAENRSLTQEVTTLRANAVASQKAAEAREKVVAELMRRKGTRDAKVSAAMERPEVKAWADTELPTALQEALK